jgi:hypothetical protein
MRHPDQFFLNPRGQMDIREWPLKKIQPQIKMTSMIRAYDDAQL